jgi:hypothetical protein
MEQRGVRDAFFLKKFPAFLRSRASAMRAKAVTSRKSACERERRASSFMKSSDVDLFLPDFA